MEGMKLSPAQLKNLASGRALGSLSIVTHRDYPQMRSWVERNLWVVPYLSDFAIERLIPHKLDERQAWAERNRWAERYL
jgi:hypothetical protein